MLSANPNAIHLLEKYPKKIDWVMFSGNPNIFTFNNDDLNMQFEKLTLLNKKL